MVARRDELQLIESNDLGSLAFHRTDDALTVPADHSTSSCRPILASLEQFSRP
jgi:hypothetical protein